MKRRETPAKPNLTLTGLKMFISFLNLKMRGLRISPDLVRAIYRLSDQNPDMAQAAISRNLGVSKSTVHRVLKGRIQGTDDRTTPNLGRPRSTNPRQDTRIHSAARRYPNTVLKDIKRRARVRCSIMTVYRRLKERRIRRYRTTPDTIT